MDLIVTCFKQYYNLDLIHNDIDFKMYNVLLSNLPAESSLMQIVNLRNTPDSEIKDINLKKIKDSIRLENQHYDPLLEFSKQFKKE